MLVFDEALEIVLSSAHSLGAERVNIANVTGRILAEDIKSDIDMPPFDKSAMDGFACRRANLGDELTVIETIPAGVAPKKTVGQGQCMKIMTGAVVPKGADCVVMKEYVETVTDNTVRFVGEKTANNICRKGEDIKVGHIILKKGCCLGPRHIAVLASVGKVQPLVARKPKVAVIATGNELVEPAFKPGLSQIRNSNSFQLTAQIENMGAAAINLGIAEDTARTIDTVFKKAVRENNVVIVSGGVSVGDFDLVPGILRQNNFELLFEKIAIKPGKPTVFGLSDNGYCFGLPGNPVSTFVLFEILVKPFLYKLMGHNYRCPNIWVPLDETIKIKGPNRQRWLPVVITRAGKVKPVEYHGSAHIGSLCGADGLISIDAGVAEVEKGTIVPVRLFRDT